MKKSLFISIISLSLGILLGYSLRRDILPKSASIQPDHSLKSKRKFDNAILDIATSEAETYKSEFEDAANRPYDRIDLFATRSYEDLDSVLEALIEEFTFGRGDPYYRYAVSLKAHRSPAEVAHSLHYGPKSGYSTRHVGSHQHDVLAIYYDRDREGFRDWVYNDNKGKFQRPHFIYLEIIHHPESGWSEFLALKEDEQQSALELLVHNWNRPTWEFMQAELNHLSPELQNFALLEAFNDFLIHDPEKARDVLPTLKLDHNQDAYYRERIALNLVDIDPSEAIKLVQEGSEQAIYDGMESVIKAWAEDDLSSAVEWVLNQPKTHLTTSIANHLLWRVDMSLHNDLKEKLTLYSQ